GSKSTRATVACSRAEHASARPTDAHPGRRGRADAAGATRRCVARGRLRDGLRRQRRRRAPPRRDRALRRGGARPRAAAHRRGHGAEIVACLGPRNARAGAHRARQLAREGRRHRCGCRRLPDQAVPHGGAAGATAGVAAPRRRTFERGTALRTAGARHAQRPRDRRRSPVAADRPRIPRPRLPDPPLRPGGLAQRPDRAHLRAGLRSRLEHGRGLHCAPAQEASARHDRDGPRPRIPPRGATMTGKAAGGTSRGSLRSRLLAGTLFWIAVSIVAAGWSLGSLFRQHVEAQLHAELTTHLDQLTANIGVDDAGRPLLQRPLSDPRLERPYSGCYWQVDAIDGARGLLPSRSLWDSVLDAPRDAPGDGEIHRHRIDGPEGARLVMVERVIRIDETPSGNGGTFRLIAAFDEALMDEPVARFRSALWLALGALAAGLVLAAVMQVRVGLAPLRSLRAALAAVHGGATQRLEGNFPGEVMPLVDEFNRVLAQKAGVVERARTQAGN